MTSAGAIGFFQDWTSALQKVKSQMQQFPNNFANLSSKYSLKPIVPSEFLKSWNKQSIEYRRGNLRREFSEGEQHDSAEGKKAKNPKIETLLFLLF